MFTYSWFLIFIALVAWMELEYYQGMDIAATQVCKGAQYQNLWYRSQKDKLKDCTIQFWLYWEALQAIAAKVLWLPEEAMENYRRVIRYTIVPHATHV